MIDRTTTAAMRGTIVSMRKLSSLIVAGSLLVAGSSFAQNADPAADVDSESYPTYPGQPPPDPNAANAVPVNAAQPAAQGQFYAYVGVHPVPYERGTGICREQGAHFHEYPPFDQYLFRESNGYFYFVGDLGDFGYDGQVYAYGSNHPIPVEFGGGYCYIPWMHRHHFAPPQSLASYYTYNDNYYLYTGSYDPYYYNYRDGYWGYYNGYYQTNYYGGRYWSVRPTPVYRPTVVVGRGLYYGGRYVPPPPGHSHLYTGPGVRVWASPRVTVSAPARVVVAPPRVVWTPPPRVVTPGVQVHAPGVTVRAPGVTVHTPSVYAPPPRVYAPAPHVYAPAPRVVVPAPSTYRPTVVVPVPRSVPAPPRRR